MTVTVSAANGSGSFSPIDVITPYSTARAARNVIHALVGGGIAVSLVDADPRKGTIHYLFDDEQTAVNAATLHAAPTAFTVTHSDRPTVAMTYVVSGDIAITLDPDSLIAWTLDVDFQEVIP